MTKFAISSHHLGKMYRIGDSVTGYQTLRESITRTLAKPIVRARNLMSGHGYGATGLDKKLWALKDVSFDVEQGEVLGIIGRNGAGKSTLLKVLSRITDPTEGFVDVRGRLGALLEVGTGFHPELTGRENVYLNGAILGMRKHEIDSRFDDIVQFAEVEQFIETPVKFYSSGMALRLGFAVAAHLEPEILVIDEVLAVGDAAFQRRCLGKMQDVSSEGRTVLFVSHNMTAILGLCTRAIWLDNGKKIADGPTDDVVQSYISSTGSHMDHEIAQREDRTGSGALKFVGLNIFSQGQPVYSVITGNSVTIALEYVTKHNEPLNNVSVSLVFHDIFARPIFSCSTLNFESFHHLPPKGIIYCEIKRLPLMMGTYGVLLSASVNNEIADRIENAFSCDVQGGDFFDTGRIPSRPNKYGPVLVEHEWNVGERVSAVKSD